MNHFLLFRDVEDVILPEVELLDVLEEGIHYKFDIIHGLDLGRQTKVLERIGELKDGIIKLERGNKMREVERAVTCKEIMFRHDEDIA